MSLLEKNRPSSKTLAWVGGIHVLVLLIAFLLPSLFRTTPPKFIEMVDIPLGTENPGEGRPDSTDTDSGGSPAAGGIQGMTPPPQNPPAPIPAPVETPAETPPPLPVVQAIKPVPDPVRQEVKPVVKKVETLKPTPAPPVVQQETVKPVEKPKNKVKANLTKIVSKTSSTTTAGNSSQSSNSKKAGDSSSGLSASEIEGKLLGKFGKGTGPGSGDKSGDAGLPGSQGNGHLGQPIGIANAPWYDTYVAIQIKKNWTPPPAGGGVPFVSVRILSDGTLEFLRLAKSSGNPELDQSAITAVQSVKKLGNPPPAGLPNPYEKIVEFK